MGDESASWVLLLGVRTAIHQQALLQFAVATGILPEID
jgi:hypothetical protein